MKLFRIMSLFALAAIVGCTTTFKTEKAADVTVSAAMTAWGNYVAQYHPPVAQEIAVRAAFEKYQAAEILAVDATKSIFDLSATNSAGTNSTATAVTQAKVTLATQAASQSLADLVNVITSFGVKLSTGTTSGFAPVPGPSASPVLK